ncbi:Hypothetical predicted protein [Marmota monax]|uniref:Uncharacterized protein n=1 Tax=Marmota monax TaxID=9995 RepID=A0A5E4CQ86_MARMO|nr:Hypothetical predicted protein [Marmota monax]
MEQLECGSRVPGGSYGVVVVGGGVPGFPWCQYLRPSAGSWSLLPLLSWAPVAVSVVRREPFFSLDL